jgi:hypothetical protein
MEGIDPTQEIRNTLIITTCQTIMEEASCITHRITEITMEFMIRLSQIAIGSTLHKRIRVPCTCPGTHHTEIREKVHAAPTRVTFLSDFPAPNSHEHFEHTEHAIEEAYIPETPSPQTQARRHVTFRD